MSSEALTIDALPFSLNVKQTAEVAERVQTIARVKSTFPGSRIEKQEVGNANR